MSEYNIKYRVGDLIKHKISKRLLFRIDSVSIREQGIFYKCKHLDGTSEILQDNVLGHVEVISLTENKED